MASSSSSSSPELSNAMQNNIYDGFSFKYASQEDVLEDLSSRFILNLPDEELMSVERICFQVEQAHWFYEDFIREVNPTFPSLPLKKFSAMLFNACPLLRQWSHDHEQAFDTFMQYKTRVPVCGAIMLNDKWDKCVLVKGWKSSSGWGFPKGKINQDEPTHSCAIREVLEETGYDLTNRLRPDDFIEMSIKEQRITLYVVGGIPEDYAFETRTRKEISKIEWFNLIDLPTWRRNKQVAGKFYLISPFVPPLKEFIKANKRSRKQMKHRGGKVNNSVDYANLSDSAVASNGEESMIDGLRTIHLDRDTQGSSSSSADNGDLQTPSPQSVEAVAVTTEARQDVASTEGPVDTHFARLLSCLTLSAKQQPLNDGVQSHTPSASSTPTPADSPVRPNPSPSKHFVILNGVASSPTVSNHHSLIDTVRSPIQSTPIPSSTTPSLRFPQSASGLTQPQSDRRLKQLALLESVAKESLNVPPPTPLANFPDQRLIANGVPSTQHPPAPPSSVPPPATGFNGSFMNPPLGYNLTPHGYQPFGAPMQPQPRAAISRDVIHVRPMTSNAILPPSLSHRRLMQHTPALSMHQGNLLSILGSNTGPHISPAGVNAHPVNQHRQMPFASEMGGVAVSHGIPPMSQSFATHMQAQDPRYPMPQSLRVMPPPPQSVLQNGPNTAPLMASIQPLSFPQPGMSVLPPNATRHTNNNKSQLLSLLNPNGALGQYSVRPAYAPTGPNSGL